MDPDLDPMSGRQWWMDSYRWMVGSLVTLPNSTPT